MRLRLFAALLALLPAASLATDDFPFQGYVAVDQAEVASGPGRRFYTTDRLPRGTTVEVYSEDASGWLAIRPPEGSFSWVSAADVEIVEPGVAKLKAETSSWIGTSVESVEQHKSQITLKVDELVEVLDQRKIRGEEGDETWLKIAPPAGEFRYIHGRDVSREPVAERVEDSQETAAENPADGAEPRRFRPSSGAIALKDLNEGRSELALAQFKSSDNTDSGQPRSPDGFVPRKRRPSQQLDTVPVPSQRFTSTERPPSQSSGPVASRVMPAAETTSKTSPSLRDSAGTVSSADVASELEQLEIDLSTMVAQDKSLWNLAELRRRAEQLVERGERAADRGAARVTLEKITEFERAFDVESISSPVSLATSNSAGPTSASTDPKYDGQGWLQPVVSKNKPAAPYALVDRDGKPLCFVSPSPGLNLNRYVNRQVGLYGRRGYLEALKTPHVTAERVIDLDRQWR